MTGTASRLTAS
jgi:NAD(P)-dependent dehydrogenase (short-subunit alcohol dehydrogenase family)